MKKLKNLFIGIFSNIIYDFLILIASSGIVVGTIINYLNGEEKAIKNLCIILFFASIALLIVAIILLIRNKKTRFIYMIDTDNKKRLKALDHINKNAEKTIHIMGIGLGSILDIFEDKQKMESLNRPIEITILGINNNDQEEKRYDIIKNAYKYQAKLEEINTVYKKIDNKLSERQNNRKILRAEASSDKSKFKTEFRKYDTFIPMNITIADKDKNHSSEMTIEYILPFSVSGNGDSGRMFIKIKKRDYKDKEIAKIANNAKDIMNKLYIESMNNEIRYDYIKEETAKIN